MYYIYKTVKLVVGHMHTLISHPRSRYEVPPSGVSSDRGTSTDRFFPYMLLNLKITVPDRADRVRPSLFGIIWETCLCLLAIILPNSTYNLAKSVHMCISLNTLWFQSVIMHSKSLIETLFRSKQANEHLCPSPSQLQTAVAKRKTIP